ncbi:MAG: glutamate-5-semialdehyde dehydrogenase, partial [Verrucomicrobia bacterium]
MDTDDLRNEVLSCGRRARVAARALAPMSTERKNAGLLAMADQLCASANTILQANSKDVEKATTDQLSLPIIDRLKLDGKRIQAMADDIRQVAALEDPVGKVIVEWIRPNGLHISKVRVPIGVIGIIYESRPNVTSDAAVLCTKTGNAVILRGGSESIRSNIAIAEALRAGAVSAGLPEDSILMIPKTDRDAVRHMAGMDQYIDLIVPRGGRALIETVVNYARMPVIKHYVGLCIAYVDREADLDMAVRIVVNAKTQRPGVCNAIETVLVHRQIAAPFFKKIAPLLAGKKVEIRADPDSLRHLSALNYQSLHSAREEDWTTEYLDLILAART